jgi:hypothetical protein
VLPDDATTVQEEVDSNLCVCVEAQLVRLRQSKIGTDSGHFPPFRGVTCIGLHWKMTHSDRVGYWVGRLHIDMCIDGRRPLSPLFGLSPNLDLDSLKCAITQKRRNMPRTGQAKMVSVKA